MPGMDGLETAQQIRATPDLQQMPAVLMVTAYGREEVLRRAEQLGLQGVLIKPVTESTMFDTIADVIGDEHAGERGPNPHAPHPAMPSTARLRSLAGRHALVVDDNALNREVAGDFLAAAGMRVDTAVDGLDALSRLDQADYDVVLMDIHMPGIDGLTAAREIRKQARWAALPIVALTARARPEDRHSSSAAGMNAHLTKPIDEATLYETLLRILPEAPAPQDHADDPVAGLRNDGAFDLPAPSPHLDLPAALKHLGGKRELLLSLLHTFTEDFAGTPVQIAADARGGRNDAVAAQAHAVKGAAAYLRADTLCTTAARLEEAARDGRADEAQAHLPRFVDELEGVLGELGEILVRTRTRSAPARPYDKALVLKRLAQAEPLIAAGDYAAQSLLAEINAHLASTPLAALAEAMRTHFDLLELEHARSVLQRLRTAIE
jgi:two-component system sensor histidine kinase/response regulator